MNQGSIKTRDSRAFTSKSLGWKSESSMISTPYIARDVDECILGYRATAPSKTQRSTPLTLSCISRHFTASQKRHGYLPDLSFASLQFLVFLATLFPSSVSKSFYSHWFLIEIGVGCHFNCCRHALTWPSQEMQNQHKTLILLLVRCPMQ